MQTLRAHLNCTLPIELFYYGQEERDDVLITLIEVRLFSSEFFSFLDKKFCNLV